MVIELINTGTELLLGRIVNSHQQWICHTLWKEGYRVSRQVTVPDTALEITRAVKASLQVSDLVITTGGLGPTSDDLTRTLIAHMLEVPLVEDPHVRLSIEQFFSNRSRALPGNVLVQALVPQGAVILPNDNGTAPGLFIAVPPGRFKSTPSALMMLPGPPRELRPMFLEEALPLIRKTFQSQSTHQVTLRTTGLGESVIEERIAPLLENPCAKGLEIGYCARVGEVDIRLSCRTTAGSEVVSQTEQQIRDALSNHIFGTDEDSLEMVVVNMLARRKLMVAVAESCTGGVIANRLTNVPGSSDAFWGGWITYSNESKIRALGVKASTLERFGAVSEETCSEMALGAKAASQAAMALAVTGIAGPGGGTGEKPVGTVYIGLATAREVTVKKFLNQYDRETFKFLTSQQALEWIRQELIFSAPGGKPSPGSP